MQLRILKIHCFSSLFLFFLIKVPIAFAQIVPDKSLPTPTQVNVSGSLIEIQGGSVAGKNLFHSFDAFSVLDGQTARFINDLSPIQNVIGRVTGQSISKIFGRIESGGSAPSFNLFLINPNGVIFGPQSSLDIRGSFLATTANSIQFGEQGSFSASNANDPSILTINPSAFVFNRVRPGKIANQANLEVPSGNSLILLGGDVSLDGGLLNAPNGRIELGGLEGTGTIALNITGNIFSLGFPNDVARSNVSFVNGSVNVTGSGSGSIVLNAKNIGLINSSLSAGIAPGLEANYIQSGEIVLDASNSVDLNNSFIENFTSDSAVGDSGPISISAGSVDLNNNSFIGSYTGISSVGNTGPVFINAGSLTLFDSSGITTYSFGNGNAGDITLKIREGINISGSNSGIASAVRGGGEGNSGSVSIRSGWLSLSDGAIIRSTIDGKGNTGNILINVDDFIDVKNSNQSLTTQIRTAVEAGSIGNGGNINIRARSLSLTGGGQLTAAVLGPDGNLSGGKGKGGNISVTTSDSVIISGIGANGFPSGIFADTELGANGPAGNIEITTNFLKIDDGSGIKLSNPQGQAGNLTINANRLTLNNGKVIAETGGDGSSNGANINLTISDLLRLENESLISAKASGNADGGNITIDTPILLALPPTGPNGSDIKATAEGGNGGNIKITAQGIFGIEELKMGDGKQTNDINASSQFGRSGQVDINTATSPNNGLTELPETVVDPDTQVAQSPCNRGWGNELTVSGRGGLPPSPSQDLSSEATQIKLVEPVQASNGTQNSPVTQEKTSSLNSVPEAIVAPAQGWVYNKKGQVVLVAYDPTITGAQRLKVSPAGCPVP